MGPRINATAIEMHIVNGAKRTATTANAIYRVCGVFILTPISVGEGCSSPAGARYGLESESANDREL